MFRFYNAYKTCRVYMLGGSCQYVLYRVVKVKVSYSDVFTCPQNRWDCIQDFLAGSVIRTWWGLYILWTWIVCPASCSSIIIIFIDWCSTDYAPMLILFKIQIQTFIFAPCCIIRVQPFYSQVIFILRCIYSSQIAIICLFSFTACSKSRVITRSLLLFILYYIIISISSYRLFQSPVIQIGLRYLLLRSPLSPLQYSSWLLIRVNCLNYLNCLAKVGCLVANCLNYLVPRGWFLVQLCRTLR